MFKYMTDCGFEPDQYMRNRVLQMHVKCGMMIQARQLFEDMPERNLVSWDTIIGGLADSGEHFEAFRLFLILWREFSDAGSRTFATVIRVCARSGLLSFGRQLHSCILKLATSDNIFLSFALIDMYSKCG